MDIAAQIEAILFISGRPMSAKKLANILKSDENSIDNAGQELLDKYREINGGLRIIKSNGNLQMVTCGEVSKVIQKFIKDETTGELSRPSLETLTIIAYRGPVSKTDLDRIRGVNCALILRNLLVRGLVEAKEKNEETFYNVSLDFLKFLGLEDVKQLPDYEKLSQDDCIDKILETSETGEQSSSDKE
ncbi:SMC-Scp complex subunit ScpB [Candidatus Falkowbacteria bacterium]|nr:SMC-Scp complex subunit ScpB [Candidatus Falkowbacteria bacterium]